MALPKRRKSHAKVRTRRANWRAQPITMTKCPNCAAAILPHRACLTCGQYNGRPVMPPKSKSSARED